MEGFTGKKSFGERQKKSERLSPPFFFPLLCHSFFFRRAAIGRSTLFPSPPPQIFFPFPFVFSCKSNSKAPPLFFFFFFLCFFLFLISDTMALWREFGLQLRRALPRSSAREMCLAQSRRYVSHSATPWGTGEVTNTYRRGLGLYKGVQSPSQAWKLARRSFSVSAQAAHGHITPPKPGEE